MIYLENNTPLSNISINSASIYENSSILITKLVDSGADYSSIPMISLTYIIFAVCVLLLCICVKSNNDNASVLPENIRQPRNNRYIDLAEADNILLDNSFDGIAETNIDYDAPLINVSVDPIASNYSTIMHSGYRPIPNIHNI